LKAQLFLSFILLLRCIALLAKLNLKKADLESQEFFKKKNASKKTLEV